MPDAFLKRFYALLCAATALKQGAAWGAVNHVEQVDQWGRLAGYIHADVLAAVRAVR